MKTGTHDRGTTFFPLYRYEGLLGAEPVRVHNLTQEFVSDWGAITQTRFVSEGYGDLESTSGPKTCSSGSMGYFIRPRIVVVTERRWHRGFPSSC
jgi:hypothetical protein